ncbi:MAG: hypothetical protein EA377_03965 [Phycisphaerales bacterium]|nr:MAG: hypothetical protein EA377_03965 [Phycisphaerales bacterium]
MQPCWDRADSADERPSPHKNARGRLDARFRGNDKNGIEDMAHDYIPRPDDQFLHWTDNMRKLLSASPESFGVTPAQASRYADLFEVFAEKYRIAIEPTTRTKPSVGAKNDARRELERETRSLAQLIQATSHVTNQQKADLGLTLRRRQTPIARPTDPPRVIVELLRGSTVHVWLRDGDTSSRGKPDGVAGATVFSYVGDQPPASVEDWKLEGLTTRTELDITFGRDGHIERGAQVWVTACWYNSRGQWGPVAEAKSTYVQCPTLWFENAELRKAA